MSKRARPLCRRTLGQQGHHLAAKSRQVPLHNIPHHPIVHHVVAVDQDISEVDDPPEIADPGGRVGIALCQPPGRLAD